MDDLNGVTFSAGIASYPDNGASFDDVLKASDRALYLAKQAGRNQVKIFEPEPSLTGRGNSTLSKSAHNLSSSK
jgi:predicted signal transduction protein with EAL and GGDEF domain